MRSLKIGVITAVVTILAAGAFAAGGDTVTNKITKDGYTFMIHLRAVPDEMRKHAKGTHHLAIMIRDAQHKEVSDANISYDFLQNGKAVVTGQLPWMAGDMNMQHGKAPMRPGRMRQPKQTGHYGADITLPGQGAYNLVITMKRGDKPVKATTLITAP